MQAGEQAEQMHHVRRPQEPQLSVASSWAHHDYPDFEILRLWDAVGDPV